jgi:hypothetical protein
MPKFPFFFSLFGPNVSQENPARFNAFFCSIFFGITLSRLRPTPPSQEHFSIMPNFSGQQTAQLQGKDD